MRPGAELPAARSVETFGLPDTVPHLIAKLRQLPPELLAQITQEPTK